MVGAQDKWENKRYGRYKKNHSPVNASGNSIVGFETLKKNHNYQVKEYSERKTVGNHAMLSRNRRFINHPHPSALNVFPFIGEQVLFKTSNQQDH